MKRTWTIIGVTDVPASFKWYQSLFGQLETAPHHVRLHEPATGNTSDSNRGEERSPPWRSIQRSSKP